MAWCQAQLRFARFATNGLAPPIAYESDSFDVVCAISVFTHLPGDLQHAWIAELRRVLKPGGVLLVTTHGDAYLGRLTKEERARYLAGDLVVHWANVPGRISPRASHRARTFACGSRPSSTSSSSSRRVQPTERRVKTSPSSGNPQR